MTSKEFIKEMLYWTTDDNTERKNILNNFLQDLERLETLNKVWHDNEPTESVDINANHLQELYNYINKLQQENEKLKKIIKENFWIFNNDEVLFRFNEHTPVMQEEIKEVLENE